jgi:hypothetical protein
MTMDILTSLRVPRKTMKQITKETMKRILVAGRKITAVQWPDMMTSQVN